MQTISKIHSYIANKSKTTLKGLSDIQFANTAIKALPIDPNPDNKTRQVTGYVYSKVKPTPRKNPKIVALSQPCLELLDLDIEKVLNDPDAPLYLSGNKLLPGSEPIAHCYCGYQFGVWANQLGDGRAITLGDLFNQNNEIWELQLKGAGKTPYSRFADGKAVLRSSIREFLCSEAMWALGIPTTRAASLVVTESLAERDPFYRGEVIHEKCAIAMRVAPTFWRFGSFEIFKGPSQGLENHLMPIMIDYLLKYQFPELVQEETKNGWNRKDTVYSMYCEIVNRTAKLVALWQCYGFMHGVLNTDNMSIIGLTIDYGPFGWMDYFNKNHICNHSDQSGRYSYQNQPSICKWNLMKLAEALKPVCDYEKMSEFCKENYDKIFENAYYQKMREKLGLYCYELPDDKKLIDNLLDNMHDLASDFTKTFRKLADYNLYSISSDQVVDIIEELSSYSADIVTLKKQNKPNYDENHIAQLKALAQSNLHFLMMMGIDPDIIEAEEQKLLKYKELEKLSQEQMNSKTKDAWTNWLKEYDNRLQIEIKSIKHNSNNTNDAQPIAGAKDLGITFNSYNEWKSYRQTRMNHTNPLYILRNYMAEEAIRQAEEGNYQDVNNLLKLLLNPFDENNEGDIWIKYKGKVPKWAAEICVSCSSQMQIFSSFSYAFVMIVVNRVYKYN